MNVYWDTSALAKRYFNEAGSAEVGKLLVKAAVSSTVVLTRAEIAGVFSRGLSKGYLTRKESDEGMREFRKHWPAYFRIRITEGLIANADSLALEYGLSGLDAVHLAAAVSWKDRVGESIIFATFDDNLWKALGSQGFEPFPDVRPSKFLRRV